MGAVRAQQEPQELRGHWASRIRWRQAFPISPHLFLPSTPLLLVTPTLAFFLLPVILGQQHLRRRTEHPYILVSAWKKSTYAYARSCWPGG